MTRAIAVLILSALAVPAAAAAAEQARIVQASGRWVVLERERSCEAVTRALKVLGPDKPQARAGFRFGPGRGQHGRFFARLGEVSGAGSPVMLTIGGEPFLLAARGQWAWTRSDSQRDRLIALARREVRFTIRGRDTRGRRFVDRYEIADAATAIDSAAACALAKRAARD